MSCRTCQPLSCINPDDLSLYSLQSGFNFTNTNLSFIMSCPVGMKCWPGFYPRLIKIDKNKFTVYVPPDPQGQTISLQCCQSKLSRDIPAGATQDQIAAIANQMLIECATQQAICDNIVTGPPGVRPPVVTNPQPAPQFRNTEVSAQFLCTNTVVFTGTLPNWISTVSFPGIALVFIGQSGVFSATTQETADANALFSITEFVKEQQLNGNLTCPPPEPPPDCNLSIPDGTVVGSFAPAVNSPSSHTYTSPTEWGEFKMEYIQGAFASTSNPCSVPPNNWKVIGHQTTWNNGFDTWNWGTDSNFSAICLSNQAAVEAALLGGFQTSVTFQPDFPASPNPITIDFIGTNAGVTNGAPNPTFKLTRTKKLKINVPTRLRIKNWNTVKLQLTACPSCQASGGAEWDGAFQTLETVQPTFIQYKELAAGRAIVGKKMDDAFVFFDANNPSVSGCGWTLQFGCLDGGSNFVYMWEGFKLLGNDPAGDYTLMNFMGHNPCSIAPVTLTLEIY